LHKYRHLDGLRGIAAFIVVLDHFCFAFLPSIIAGSGYQAHYHFERWFYGTPLYLLVNGDLSVCVFFILSGFVLSAKFFRTGDDEVYRASAAKRYIRLSLPIAGSVVIGFILMRLHLLYNVPAGAITGSSWFQNFWQFSPSILEAIRESTYSALSSDGRLYNLVLWTMQYEFIGSFMIFGLLAFFGKLRNRGLVYTALILLFAILHSYFLAFILGVMISDYYHRRPESFEMFRSPLWLGLAVLGIVLGAYPAGSSSGTIYQYIMIPGVDDGVTRILLHMVGALSVFMLCLMSTRVAKILVIRPIALLGRISFSVYLLHIMVLGSLSSYLFLALRYSYGYGISVAITFAASVTVILAVAYLYEKYVDRYAIELSSRFYENVLKSPKDGTRRKSRSRRAATPPISIDPAMPGVAANIIQNP
jgi:peptidoglycan/LPS O-acetylase OafA/YrhL